ncbi:MAG: hypothetical protein ABI673_06800 [Novosphingobium sp.]
MNRKAAPLFAILLSLASLVVATGATEAAARPLRHARALPADVRNYIARRDSCDHWRGEDPYDAARAREIAAAVVASCKGTDAALARLRHRYARDRRVITALSGYEKHIE